MKKICKKLKVPTGSNILKHYKDGDFHKDYDRQITVTSIVNFMRDPTGDLPWEEDPIGVDVVHVPDAVVSLFLKSKIVLFKSINITLHVNITDVRQIFEKRDKTSHGNVLCAMVWLLQNSKARIFNGCDRTQTKVRVISYRCKSSGECSNQKIVQHNRFPHSFVLRRR